MMLQFKDPIPVIVEGNKEAYAIYAESGGQFENDCWTVVHCDGGVIRHYTTDQIRVHHNETYTIKKKVNNA